MPCFSLPTGSAKTKAHCAQAAVLNSRANFSLIHCATILGCFKSGVRPGRQNQEKSKRGVTRDQSECLKNRNVDVLVMNIARKRNVFEASISRF